MELIMEKKDKVIGVQINNDIISWMLFNDDSLKTSNKILRISVQRIDIPKLIDGKPFSEFHPFMEKFDLDLSSLPGLDSTFEYIFRAEIITKGLITTSSEHAEAILQDNIKVIEGK
jgi:hypothetical protein